jgi:hypothetical protein
MRSTLLLTGCVMIALPAMLCGCLDSRQETPATPTQQSTGGSSGAVGAEQNNRERPPGAPGAGQAKSQDKPMAEGRRDDMATPLLGAWVQDDSGFNHVTRRRYHFKRDGSYELVVTSRTSGDVAEKVLTKEEGTFTAEAGRLTISPKGGRARSFPWRVEKEPNTTDLRLVMVLPDRILDVYYRE